jgi:glycerol-3-phosphate cytidylyltransferase
MSIVYTGGTFDLLHPGHIDLLRTCREIAGQVAQDFNYKNCVIVSLNEDNFVEKFKGKKPVCSYEERKEMLESCKYVDSVIANTGGADSKKTITSLKTNIDFIVIGDDWCRKDYYKQMGFTPNWLLSQGIGLIYVARLRPLSSTEIKERAHGQLGFSPLPEKPIGFTEKLARLFRAPTR